MHTKTVRCHELVLIYRAINNSALNGRQFASCFTLSVANRDYFLLLVFLLD